MKWQWALVGAAVIGGPNVAQAQNMGVYVIQRINTARGPSGVHSVGGPPKRSGPP